MENELKKKYGLPTAICMVVGIVIGSGVFFKAEAVLNKTGGNMFGATVLVPIIVQSYGLPLSIQTTLLFAGLGTLFFHACTKFKVPAFLGSSFAFLGGFSAVANLNSGKYAGMTGAEKLPYALGGIVVAGCMAVRPRLPGLYCLFLLCGSSAPAVGRLTGSQRSILSVCQPAADLRDAPEHGHCLQRRAGA